MFKSGVFQNTLQGPPHCAATDSFFFSLSTRRKQGSRNVRQGSLVAKVDRKVREESICVKDLRPYEKKAPRKYCQNTWLSSIIACWLSISQLMRDH